MLVFVGRRIVELLPVLFGVLVLTFAVTRLTPGDPAELVAGAEAEPEVIEAVRQRMGLDRPIPTQFALYVGRLARGDMGVSYHSGRDVRSVLWTALVLTSQISLVAMIVTVVIGVPLGIVSAVHKDTWFDAVARITSLIGVSIPNFFFGLLLILLFSYYLGWLPSFGSGTWRHVLLPGITLGTFSTGLVARLARSSMLDIMEQDYIRTARAKGVRNFWIVYKHGLRNAAISIVTILGLNLGHLLSGSVVTETVFSYPGLGQLVVRSIFQRDLVMVQGAILLIAVIYVVVNLLVDIAYGLVDPRIRYQ